MPTTVLLTWLLARQKFSLTAHHTALHERRREGGREEEAFHYSSPGPGLARMMPHGGERKKREENWGIYGVRVCVLWFFFFFRLWKKWRCSLYCCLLDQNFLVELKLLELNLLEYIEEGEGFASEAGGEVTRNLAILDSNSQFLVASEKVLHSLWATILCNLKSTFGEYPSYQLGKTRSWHRKIPCRWVCVSHQSSPPPLSPFLRSDCTRRIYYVFVWVTHMHICTTLTHLLCFPYYATPTKH